MMRVKINLDTMTDINDFVKIMAGYDGNVYLTDKDRAFVVSANPCSVPNILWSGARYGVNPTRISITLLLPLSRRSDPALLHVVGLSEPRCAGSVGVCGVSSVLLA